MINVQNIDDNTCFKWCLVRYLNPAGHHSARITKADKDFAKSLDFKDIKAFTTLKKEKNSVGICDFGYEVMKTK